MKRYSQYIYVLALLFLFTSCKKLTEDLNVNPNQPTDAPADLLLNGAQVASIIVYEGNLARLAGIYTNTFTGADRQYSLFNTYTSTAPDYDDAWDNLYYVVGQAKLGEEKAAKVNNRLMRGMFQVIQAQAFGLAADVWGDVPFTEVGNPEKYPTPKFDTQASVYAGVQTILDDAIANLGSGVGSSPGSKDIFFQGSASKWTQVAYTLKARFYLHAKNYPAAITAARLGISSVSNNMVARHGETYLSDFNVFYSFLTYDRPGYMTAGDAFLPMLLDETTTKYRGNSKTDENARFNYLFQVGLNTADLEPNVLVDFDWGNASDENGFFGASTAFPLVTYQENNLILAEAIIKSGGAISDALVELNKHRQFLNSGGGISSGYASLGLVYEDYVLADFAAGGIENPTGSGLTNSQALLKEVLEEKYIALVGQIEQFNDVRRTKNLIGIPAKVGTKLPQRFLYPQTEINTNPNTPKLVAGDLFKETTANTSAY